MAVRKMKIHLDTWCTQGLSLLKKEKFFVIISSIWERTSQNLLLGYTLRFGIEKMGFLWKSTIIILIFKLN